MLKVTQANVTTGGCEHVDVVEQLAIDRLKKIFGAEAANVQPNSGSGQPRRVLRSLETARHHHGYVFGGRRSLDSRYAFEHVG